MPIMVCNILYGSIKYFSYLYGLNIELRSLVTKVTGMYGHLGFGGLFEGSIQGMGQGLPMHSGVINNSRVHRNIFRGSSGINIDCPMRKVLCSELRVQDAGLPVEICLRIQSQRLGRFLSLKDDNGIIQLVVPDDRIDIQERLRNMPLNSFLVLKGFITARPHISRNEKMAAGDIEELIHPKRKKNESDIDEDFKSPKKKDSISFAYSKITSEDLSKDSTPLITHFSQRSHTCVELGKSPVGKNITLCGNKSAKRVGRYMMLKDGYGSVEIVPENQNVALTNKFQNLHVDPILSVKGDVSRPPTGRENPRVENGNIEVLVESLTVANPYDPVLPGKLKGKGSEGGDGDDSGKRSDGIMIQPEEIKEEQTMPNPNKYCNRTHTCGELNESNVGQTVRLMGWIEFNRMDKFILLRDRYGQIQLIIPDLRDNLKILVRNTPLQSVILVEGTVCLRPPGEENVKQKTGFIEVSVTYLKVLNPAKEMMPFLVRDFVNQTDVVGMKYRYLYLRRRNLQENLRLRSNTVHKMRKFLVEQFDFLEVETPTLFKRTPGGAQEFIVPTRIENKFYSLVQSPQQFKQLLMVGSADRYFQFARCYRDESIENDRQPEFTQLDLEMSFCDREDIYNLIEDLLEYCWPGDIASLPTPFPRLTYEEAMNSYGTDKPDLRFDWKIKDLTQILQEQKNYCKGKIDIKNILDEKNFAVHAFIGRQGCKFINAAKKNIVSEIQELYKPTKLYCFPVKTIESTKETFESLFSETVAEEIEKTMNFGKGDVLFMGVGPKHEVLKSLGSLRVKFANYLEENNVEVIQKKAFNFLWVQDFPLFLEEKGEIVSCHHPFTQPHPDDFHLLEKEPLKVKSLHYDLVLNGNEVGGGSIRIHDAKLQEMVLEKILNIKTEHLSHLLDALDSGAPPHGGIAIGLDRLIAILCGAKTIKDVIAFPKTRLGQDLMGGAPCNISDTERELYFLKKDL